jgi:topoisomerase IV subunit A
MKRDLTKPKRKEKIIRLPISKLIDTKFRDYAVYVLEQRGIPNFYDALTPVQRYILKNSPATFNKTLGVVGKSIEDGYHHGDSSLSGAIARLARPFGNALQILEGYGFFGSEVSPSPAAARYTSVKLSAKANEILNKYKHLTTREEDGPYDPFWMEIPIGLTVPIIGIAVGYATTVLPRKAEHIREFLEGKRKVVKPYFEGFNGTIEKYKGMERSWMLSSTIEIDGKKIQINDIPPILKYTSVLKKLDYVMNKFEGKVRIVNNSNTKVNIAVVYTGTSKEQWEEIQKFVHKSFSILVSENPVFIKDGQVLVYDNIEQYLEDYRWQVLRLKMKNNEFEQHKLDVELRFNQAKMEFIEFMLSKKRDNAEIDQYFKTKKLDKEIVGKLEGMTARKFTKDELLSTAESIKELLIMLKAKVIELADSKKAFETAKDPTVERGVTSKVTNVNLFDTDDVSENEVDGVVLWSGADVFEEEEKELEDSE